MQDVDFGPLMDAHALIAFFRGQPVITLFLLLGFGYLVGRITVAGFSLGPVAGTLLVSIALGQLGFRISAGAQAVGLALFIFSIGYQAGPRFLEILKSDGLRYFALAVFVSVIGFLITWTAGKLLSLPPGANRLCIRQKGVGTRTSGLARCTGRRNDFGSRAQPLDPAGQKFSPYARLHRHLRARQHHFDDCRHLDPLRVNGDFQNRAPGLTAIGVRRALVDLPSRRRLLRRRLRMNARSRPEGGQPSMQSPRGVPSVAPRRDLQRARSFDA